jgi:hypothetical protein
MAHHMTISSRRWERFPGKVGSVELIVKAASKLREETVLSYAQRLANHESGHCEQIDRVLQTRRQLAHEG